MFSTWMSRSKFTGAGVCRDVWYGTRRVEFIVRITAEMNEIVAERAQDLDREVVMYGIWTVKKGRLEYS